MEEFTDLIEARNRERQLKDFSRKKKEALWNVGSGSSRQAKPDSNNK